MCCLISKQKSFTVSLDFFLLLQFLIFKQQIKKFAHFSDPQSLPLVTTNLFSVSNELGIQIPHIREIMWYLSFLYLSFTQNSPSRSSRIVINGQILFFFVAEQYSIVQTHHHFFTRSCILGHTHCCRILVFVNNTAVSMEVPVHAAAESLQSCPTLCDPIDGSPPGSPVPGILQARTLEWVAISFSNA